MTEYKGQYAVEEVTLEMLMEEDLKESWYKNCVAMLKDGFSNVLEWKMWKSRQYYNNYVKELSKCQKKQRKEGS